MSQEALADAVEYSYEQTASIEQGRRPAKARFTECAEEVLGGWGLGGVAEGAGSREAAAVLSGLRVDRSGGAKQVRVRPAADSGLLQTEAYARALFSAHCPPLDEETVGQHVEAPIGRQKLLTRTPPVELSLVIGEPALQCIAGDRDVMVDQFKHLVELGKLRNVEIQIMPTARRFHPGLNGPLVLLETPERRQVGYVESQEVGVVVTGSAQVSAFTMRYGKPRSQALSAEEAARLIECVAGEQ
ncbi:DUF5753 domain-containing protein [Streptomyces sp. D54]|uniref:DUF5753 domain-containing protein n=1 Tax=Streptomyces sp. D54 TaxID=1290289 RepID=UPI003CEEE129